MAFRHSASDSAPPSPLPATRCSIGVFNVDGQFYAIRNRCPHQGAALCEGKLWGVLKADKPGSYEYSGSKEIIACISHGWEFSVKTGQSWCDPERLRVRSYDVSVEDQAELEPETPAAAEDVVKNPLIVTANTTPAGGGPAAAAERAPEPPAMRCSGTAEGVVRPVNPGCTPPT